MVVQVYRDKKKFPLEGEHVKGLTFEGEIDVAIV
jgi:hypothetical protein